MSQYEPDNGPWQESKGITGPPTQADFAEPLAAPAGLVAGFGGSLGHVMAGTPVVNTFPVELARKLFLVMRDSGYIKKDKRNDFQKYNYVSEEAMVYNLREKMIEHGVFLLPSVAYTEMIKQDNPKGGHTYITRVHVNYTVIDVDSGQQHTFMAVGDGTDKGDKAVYKALTGANKYALMKLFQIPTGDDPEKDSWQGRDEQEEQPKTKKKEGKKKPDQQTANFLAAVNKILAGCEEPDAEVDVTNRVLGGMGFTSLTEVTSSPDRRKFVEDLRQEVARVTGQQE